METSDFSKDFHIFGLEWDKDEIVFYLDRKEIRREKNTFCLTSAPILLSLAIIAWAGEVTDKIDGTYMEVDYVRVYQKKDEQLPKRTNFTPGTLWKDTNGHPINAHGGGIIYSNDRYYWYGEHKLPGRSEKEGADGGVHCYSSTDLYNWDDEGVVLAVDNQPGGSDIEPGCILERPKVVYHRQTKMYVMYFKFYPKGTGYDTGYVGVATASAPAGPFVYSHKFLGAGSPKGSGDFCMYQDENGTVYHFTVRKPDKAFCMGKLNQDYLYPANEYRVLPGIPLHTEAPAMVRALGKYYLLGSGSSGWAPNAARAFSAPSITGEYAILGNPCTGINPNNQFGPEKTFGGQVSFILPVEGRENAYIALFDIWNPERASDGLYVWLPLQFKDGNPVIEWQNQWDLSFFKQSKVSK
jgi:hypothetical protein